MPEAHILQHIGFEGIDSFAPPLLAHGYDLQAHWPALATPTDIDAGDLLIVLGGPIGADEAEQYPFLKQESALIERHMAGGGAVLGVCLGAQLIAQTLGAKVYPMRTKEIGFSRLTLTQQARKGIFASTPASPIALHWHGDTFDLPKGAERLASTEVCLNQVFNIGYNVLGLQCHMETDARSIEHWIVGHAIELKDVGTNLTSLRADAQRYTAEMASTAESVLTKWLEGLPK